MSNLFNMDGLLRTFCSQIHFGKKIKLKTNWIQREFSKVSLEKKEQIAETLFLRKKYLHKMNVFIH